MDPNISIMLDDLEEVCRLYLEQSSSYLDGCIGNPFAITKDKDYVTGIIENKHNPVAIHGLIKLVEWYENDYTIYYTYFTKYYNYFDLVDVISIWPHIHFDGGSWALKYVNILLNKFPEFYGSTCTIFHEQIPSEYFTNGLIVNINSSDVYGAIRLGFGVNLISALKAYIKTRKPNRTSYQQNLKYAYKRMQLGEIHKYIGIAFHIIKNCGNLYDVDRLNEIVRTISLILTYSTPLNMRAIKELTGSNKWL